MYMGAAIATLSLSMLSVYWLGAVIFPYVDPSPMPRTAGLRGGTEKMTAVQLVSRRMRRKVSVLYTERVGFDESDVCW